MQTLSCIPVALCIVLIGCAPSGPAPDTEFADAQAEADEATAVDFSGAVLRPCALLTREEVAAAIGPLTGDPVQPVEQAADTAESRCVWRSAEEHALVLAASGEGGMERLGAIEPYETPAIEGDWDEARLQGCCLLHAVGDDVLLSLDFSAAPMALAQAGQLMDLALARRHEPPDTP